MTCRMSRRSRLPVEVVPNQGKGAAMLRVAAARRHFGAIWFNEATTAAGIEALGWYHEKRDDVRGIGLGPDHDWSSNGADSFGLGCVCAEQLFAELGHVTDFDPNKGHKRAFG